MFEAEFIHVSESWICQPNLLGAMAHFSSDVWLCFPCKKITLSLGSPFVTED